jgi:DNA-binding XRE family transcriptional regulator
VKAPDFATSQDEAANGVGITRPAFRRIEINSVARNGSL